MINFPLVHTKLFEEFFAGSIVLRLNQQKSYDFDFLLSSHKRASPEPNRGKAPGRGVVDGVVPEPVPEPEP